MGDGDDHLFPLDEILDIRLELRVIDGCPARVGKSLLHIENFFSKDGADFFTGRQNGEIFGDLRGEPLEFTAGGPELIHGVSQAVIGMAKDGRLMEVWSSYTSRSFTVLMTWPTMKSCIVATGSDRAMLGIGLALEGLFGHLPNPSV